MGYRFRILSVLHISMARRRLPGRSIIWVLSSGPFTSTSGGWLIKRKHNSAVVSYGADVEGWRKNSATFPSARTARRQFAFRPSNANQPTGIKTQRSRANNQAVTSLAARRRADPLPPAKRPLRGRNRGPCGARHKTRRSIAGPLVPADGATELRRDGSNPDRIVRQAVLNFPPCPTQPTFSRPRSSPPAPPTRRRAAC